jgi:hypothetical protein
LRFFLVVVEEAAFFFAGLFAGVFLTEVVFAAALFDAVVFGGAEACAGGDGASPDSGDWATAGFKKPR